MAELFVLARRFVTDCATGGDGDDGDGDDDDDDGGDDGDDDDDDGDDGGDGDGDDGDGDGDDDGGDGGGGGGDGVAALLVRMFSSARATALTQPQLSRSVRNPLKSVSEPTTPPPKQLRSISSSLTRCCHLSVSKITARSQHNSIRLSMCALPRRLCSWRLTRMSGARRPNGSRNDPAEAEDAAMVVAHCVQEQPPADAVEAINDEFKRDATPLSDWHPGEIVCAFVRFANTLRDEIYGAAIAAVEVNMMS